MHTTSADFTNCLKCNGPIHVAAMFAVKGIFTRPRLSRYLGKRKPRFRLWIAHAAPSLLEIHRRNVVIRGVCREVLCTRCGYTVRITSTEISDELHARQMLDHKIFLHEEEKHSA
jgi:hypothetical protein